MFGYYATHSLIVASLKEPTPDSKVHGAHMGPTWGRQDPGGCHVGHVNLAIWDALAWGPLSSHSNIFRVERPKQ